MKWSKTELMSAPNQEISFSDELTFDAAAFARMNQIRGVKDVMVSGNIRYDEQDDRVYADIAINGTMILPCSLTNEDVEYPFDTASMEVFVFTKSEEDVHEAKGDIIELLPVIFQLILMEVPLKVVKEGATYPKGNGWEVMKEEDWQKNKQDEIDPRLAKLKEFKVEED